VTELIFLSDVQLGMHHTDSYEQPGIFEVQGCNVLMHHMDYIRFTHANHVILDAILAIVVATGPKVCGFKPS
jgi:hypothetical protein